MIGLKNGRSGGHRSSIGPTPGEVVVRMVPPTVAAAPDTAPETTASDPADAALTALLAAAVTGEPRAVDRLLREIYPPVLRYCRARLGRQETVIGAADDVAQEVCVAVVGALASYRMRGLSFRSFVYGIAAHKVTDAFRAAGRNRTEPVAELPDAPVLDSGPEHRVLDAELVGQIDGLLARLTARQREVLVLRIQVGLSAEETARVLGSTPGAVRVTQHRALNRLRRIVGSRYDVDPSADLSADFSADFRADSGPEFGTEVGVGLDPAAVPA